MTKSYNESFLDLSLIVPCHNEEANIRPLYEAVSRAIPSRLSWEIIFIDDGSRDGTLPALQRLRNTDTRVKYLSLLTNYGHQHALMTGLRACRGRYGLMLDADLQHPPECIPEFLEEQQRSGADIIDGRRRGTQQRWLKACLSNWFSRVFRCVSGIAVEPGVSDFRLCTRRAVDLLCSIQEPHPFLRGMIPHLQLRRSFVDYDLGMRHAGTPSYTFRKSLHLAWIGLLRFSDLPYRVGLLVSGLFMLVATLQGVNYLYRRFFTNNFIPGNTDIVLLLCLGFSVTTCLLVLLLRQSTLVLDRLREQPTVIVAEQALNDGPEVDAPVVSIPHTFSHF